VHVLTADYILPAGIYGAALSVDNWDSAAWCGACLSVVGPKGNSIKIMVSGEVSLFSGCPLPIWF
jgi:hypothetical protein